MLQQGCRKDDAVVQMVQNGLKCVQQAKVNEENTGGAKGTEGMRQPRAVGPRHVQVGPKTCAQQGIQNMGKAHAVVIPLPAPGHIKPLMDLSHCLVQHGFIVTFVNTDFSHSRALAALKESGEEFQGIRLVSIPDGMAPGEDRNHMGNVWETLERTMASHLEALISEINAGGGDKITCMIADMSCWPALKVAGKLGIRRASFCPAAAGVLASFFAIPKLVEDGTLDENGIPTVHRMVKLSPAMHPMNTAHFTWLIGDLAEQQRNFGLMFRASQAVKDVDWLLCNSLYELEAPVFNLFPNILPIGSLLSSNRPGQLWAEDPSCLSWLSEQRAQSVIYVAFGSTTIFDQHQFHELALGLELSDRPFLWVVRPDLTNGPRAAYPDGFEARVAARGRMVTWSPQEKVLAHPSIACFLTHCGWNSTMEGLSMGVPFLCWPYFADQFHNKDYIVDAWKVGLGLEGDTDGIIPKEEVKNKIDKLLSDEGIRARAFELKEQARRSAAEGGSSLKNFNDFVKAMKG